MKSLFSVWSVYSVVMFGSLLYASDPKNPNEIPPEEDIIKIKIGMHDPLKFYPDGNTWNNDDEWIVKMAVDTKKNGKFGEGSEVFHFTASNAQPVQWSPTIILKGGYPVRFTLKNIPHPTPGRGPSDSDEYEIGFRTETLTSDIPWIVMKDNSPLLQGLQYAAGFGPSTKGIFWQFTPMNPQVDLEMQELEDEKTNQNYNEENPGAILPIDPSLQDSQKPPKLYPVKVSYKSGGMAKGKIKIDLEGDQSRVALFEDNKKSKPFKFPFEIDVATELDKLPSMLFVQGKAESRDPQGTKLVMTYTPPEGEEYHGFKQKHEVVSMTVVNPKILVDGNRDGAILDDGSDKTSAEKPYRFWVNEDADVNDEEWDPVPSDFSDAERISMNCARNLEDYARIHFKLGVLDSIMQQGKAKVELKWKNGGAKLVVHAHEKGTTEYLESITEATEVIEKSNDTKVILNSTLPGALQKDFFSMCGVSADGRKYALFQAMTPGRGELAINIKNNRNKDIAQSSGVWLDLKNIKTMYERVRILPENSADPYDYTGPGNNPPSLNYALQDDSGSNAFESDPNEDITHKNYIVFVHGWRMDYSERINFSETMYKRLWHRGYKGRFAAFMWPTYFNNFPIREVSAYLAKFNESEYRAWHCGALLKQYVDGLPSAYAKNLVAHSMGNIVAGSALSQGMSVNSYALLNGAVSASCYDTRIDLYQPINANVPNPAGSLLPNLTYWGYQTPDDDPDDGTRALAYRGRLESVSGNLVNFYLPQDEATTTAWEFNQYAQKPMRFAGIPPLVGFTGYSYDPQRAAGSKIQLSFVLSAGRLIQTPFEVMTMANQSRTKAVGAEPRTRGSIAPISVDMNQLGMNFRVEHSAEFVFSIQQLKLFYNELLRTFDIERNP